MCKYSEGSKDDALVSLIYYYIVLRESGDCRYGGVSSLLPYTLLLRIKYTVFDGWNEETE